MSFKKKGKQETITVALSKFNGGNDAHTATAAVNGRLVGQKKRCVFDDN